MDDAEAVSAIERRHELELLDRLLEERSRPVPPAPVTTHHHPQRQDLIDVMRLLARTFSTTLKLVA